MLQSEVERHVDSAHAEFGDDTDERAEVAAAEEQAAAAQRSVERRRKAEAEAATKARAVQRRRRQRRRRRWQRRRRQWAGIGGLDGRCACAAATREGTHYMQQAPHVGATRGAVERKRTQSGIQPRGRAEGRCRAEQAGAREANHGAGAELCALARLQLLRIRHQCTHCAGSARRSSRGGRRERARAPRACGGVHGGVLCVWCGGRGGRRRSRGGGSRGGRRWRGRQL
mmetsp:Transcript_14934/g.37769  ORF Transcript_14934/g.37769 Transcript_14934/m.37769 type:complete len:228 (-) Transcript_14934:58-741(-)